MKSPASADQAEPEIVSRSEPALFQKPETPGQQVEYGTVVYHGDHVCASEDAGLTCWNTTSSLFHEPYSYSKTLAEKEAWRLAERQDRWSLVTINPSMILGPSLNSAPTSDSFSTIRMLIDGTTRLGAPRVGISVVDVREVAQAHIAAAFLSEAHGRYITSAEDTDVFALTSTLLPRFGGSLPLPRRAAPRPVVIALAPALGQTRAYIRRNVGHAVRVDASRSRLELGTRYRPAQTSMEEMVEQMLARQGKPSSHPVSF